MVCTQIKVYIAFLVCQILITVYTVGPASIPVFGPLVLIGILYLLCKYNQFMIANVLIAINIILSALLDTYALTHEDIIKRILHIKVTPKHQINR